LLKTFSSSCLFHMYTVHPFSLRHPYALLKFMAQFRRPHGTQKDPLTAASSRTCQASWVSVAQDLNVHTNSLRQTIKSPYLKWEFSLAIADCEYKAPLLPRLARHYIL